MLNTVNIMGKNDRKRVAMVLQKNARGTRPDNGRIQHRHGVLAGTEKPIGVTFGINTLQGAQGFLLPANIEGVLKVFAKQKVKADREQAERTAWRNIRDWILAQMAFVEAGNVEVDEVFLPYLTDGKGKTLYQVYKDGQLLLEG